MKHFQKLFSFFEKSINQLPDLSLCHARIKIDAITKKPYFLVAPIGSTRGDTTEKLFLDKLKSNMNFYKRQFLAEDWAVIQYNLGGIESLQIGGTYRITSFDFENIRITVRDKNTLIEEVWDVASIIPKKQYLNLDKESIFQFGMYYENVKNSLILQTKIEKEMELQMKSVLHFDLFKNQPVKQNSPHLTLVKHPKHNEQVS